MKLSQIKPRTETLTIVLPNGEESDIKFSLVGQDSKSFQQKKLAAAKYWSTKKEVDLDMAVKDDNELVASCIVGWSGLENDDGTPLLYTPDEAIKLVSDPELAFIKEQIFAFIQDRQNFFRKPGEAA